MTAQSEIRDEDAFELELFGLITRYEDDVLDEGGLSRLNELLIGHAVARDIFNDVCLQSLAIGEAISVEDAAKQGIAPSKPRRKLIAFPSWAYAAAAAVVALFATFHHFTQQDVPALDPRANGSGSEIVTEPLAIRVQAKSGTVEFLDADGTSVAGEEFKTLAFGNAVATHGPESYTVLTYPDGTRLELGPDAFVTFANADRKLVLLERGELRASVQPQPAGKPFGVRTPHLELTVVGTEFLVTADADDTSVRVFEGRVQVERLSDQDEVELVAGQNVAVAPEGELLVASLPLPSPSESGVGESPTSVESNGPPVIKLNIGEKPAIQGVVALGEPAIFHGTVFDANGRVAVNALVTFHLDQASNEAVAEATTDSQGHFEAKVSTSGKLVLRVGSTFETKVVATAGQVSDLGNLIPNPR